MGEFSRKKLKVVCLYDFGQLFNNNSVIFLCTYRTPKRKRRSPTPKPTKVHVGHLTRNVTKEHIMEIFSLYGTIKSVDMPVDRTHPSFNRGSAYIDYESSEETSKAIKFMDGG